MGDEVQGVAEMPAQQHPSPQQDNQGSQIPTYDLFLCDNSQVQDEVNKRDQDEVQQEPDRSPHRHLKWSP